MLGTGVVAVSVSVEEGSVRGGNELAGGRRHAVMHVMRHSIDGVDGYGL